MVSTTFSANDISIYSQFGVNQAIHIATYSNDLEKNAISRIKVDKIPRSVD